jgi:ArsR family transcriptional regulator, arsenate/arsenite/antimonite-responsive transcriptional repressor
METLTFQRSSKYFLNDRHYFYIRGNMETSDAVAALAALAQDNRLEIFRLLVRAGRDGMPAGRVAEALDLAPNTLTFHFDRLRGAGLVTVRRDGRSMIYAARYEAMNGLIAFLTENCCQGVPDACAPAAVCKPAKPAKPTRKKERV